MLCLRPAFGSPSVAYNKKKTSLSKMYSNIKEKWPSLVPGEQGEVFQLFDF